jgi:hypothetical protein
VAPELEDLLAQFPEWSNRIDGWHKRIPSIDLEAILKLPPQQRETALQEAGKNLGQATEQAGPRPNAVPFIEKLCDLFVKGTPEDRAKIYRSFAENQTLRLQLEGVYGLAARRIQGPEDAEILRMALAAVGIEDARGHDFRDTILAFQALLEAATRADIAYTPIATEVINLLRATPGTRAEPPSGISLLREYLK